MGCSMSTEDSPQDSKQTSTMPGTQDTDLLPVKKKKSAPTRDGLDAKAEVPHERSLGNSDQNFRLGVFDKPPPKYGRCPATLQLGFESFPAGVIVVLNLLKEAAQLTCFGHKGAWAALSDRHGQIWLDSAHTLRPVTRKAILLYAAIRLLVGKALDSNMTFYFTTFPNLETEQLSDSELKTLNALVSVFNAKTFLKAGQLIREHSTALAGQGLEDYINNEHSFLETDTQDDKNGQAVGNDQRQDEKALARMAHQGSRLRKTSIAMAVASYKRQLESKSVHPLTCTFILGTRLEPAEVDAIQQCQRKGQEAARGVRRKMKESLWEKSTRPEPSLAGEDAGSVAKELELEGHQFCIQAIVFCDQLNSQAKKAYEKVDNFLKGQQDDINDVTYVSEVKFLLYFLTPELRSVPQYNDKRIIDEEDVIWLPGDRLIRWFVLGIVDDDDDDDDEEQAQFSNHKTRDPQPEEVALANRVKLGTVPNARS
ncbi:hypothetical protein CEP52_017433 [Fusarium oligoseptatum]|uniref:Uncharacterized protein n=1 Tax=Fusarium oligoseptatum TaxID=2604345 RepID=A0A428RRB2_9HYPO|nr:hypothetical protein CEP52_017433 [Fusarium oligoseptatum]